jgi:hypothetical protein
MSTAQLLQEKKTILQQLETTNDEELLHEIYLLLRAEINNWKIHFLMKNWLKERNNQKMIYKMDQCNFF